MDVRGLTTECEVNPYHCYKSQPSSLIYCLTVAESIQGSDHLRRVVRCLSQASYNITEGELHEALHGQRECNFGSMTMCECPNCRVKKVEEEIAELEKDEKVEKKPEVTMPILKSLSIQRVDTSTTATSTTPSSLNRTATTAPPTQNIVDTAFDVNRKPAKPTSADGQSLGSSGGPKRLGFPWQNFGSVPSENGGGGSAGGKGREATPKLWSVDRGKNTAGNVGRHSLTSTQVIIMLISACTVWLYRVGIMGGLL